MAAAQTLECAYGYEMKTPDDRLLQMIETTAKHLEQAIMPTGEFRRGLNEPVLRFLPRLPSQYPPLVKLFPIVVSWDGMEESSQGMARRTSAYG